MKRAEISYNAEVKELEKLTGRLERAKAKLEKATAKAEKYGVKEMTSEEHRKWLDTVETKDYLIKNKEDINKNGAWFDYLSAQKDVEDIKGRIERTEQRLTKKFEAYEREQELEKKLTDAKAIKEKQKLEFEEEKKEWAKDGIILERRYAGTTPKGNHFSIYGNNGFTKRSLRCFTLYINGETIFTSGYFWRAYLEIKNR